MSNRLKETAMAEATREQDWREWMRALGRQTRRVREFLGLSQEQIARLAGVSQGAVSRLEGGRGLATPLLVVVKLNIAIRSALRKFDADVLSPEARDIISRADLCATTEEPRFVEYPLAKDEGVEEFVRLYRRLPEKQRDKLLAVVRATALALSPSEEAHERPRSRQAS
jgi:transcriptional regulator with XRE-family HTH domain